MRIAYNLDQTLAIVWFVWFARVIYHSSKCFGACVGTCTCDSTPLLKESALDIPIHFTGHIVSNDYFMVAIHRFTSSILIILSNIMMEQKGKGYQRIEQLKRWKYRKLKTICKTTAKYTKTQGTFSDKVTPHIDGFTVLWCSMWCSSCRKYFCIWFQTNDTNDK